jgi:hypothetical protein
MAGHVRDTLEAQTSAKGGLSETDVNELTAIPIGPELEFAVITVTPVGNEPHSRRRWSLVISMGYAPT